MKEFFLTSAGIFIFYAPLIFDQAYCQISKASLQRNPNKNLRYALFKDHLFHVLDVKKLEGDTVHTWKHCLLRCAKNEQCFSTNIGAFPRPNGNFTCELLPTDKYNASNKFKANHTFYHYSIVSPCESFPCQHGGSCRALYETDDYSCTCTQNYTGRNCEIRHCNHSVGVANASIIPDDHMTASSVYNTNYLAAFGRLNSIPNTLGWCTRTNDRIDEWLQIDFGRTIEVCAVATQGRSGEYVTDFKLSFSSHGNTTWTTYMEENGAEMEFHRDGVNAQIDYHRLPVPLSATFIRFHPTKFYRWKCLRVEVYVSAM